MKIVAGFFIILFTFCWTLPASAFAEDIAVIVNEIYPLSSTSPQEIKQIYLGEKQYEGSLKIIPIDQKDSLPIKQKFIEKVLSTNPETYKGYWIKRFFKAGDVPPVIKASSEEIIDAVIQNPGNVGYVWAGEANGKSGIKVILTIKAD